MAYVNELGQTVSCSVPFMDQVNNFFSGWYFTLLPLVLLIGIFFLIKKYTKNKGILIFYVIIVALLYLWWIIVATRLICV